jgi:hypothetical protein
MESYELNLENYPKNKRQAIYRSKKIPIIGIKNGKAFPFESSFHAARFLNAKNIAGCAKNIQKVCHGERKTIKGIMWFFERDFEKYKDLIQK